MKLTKKQIDLIRKHTSESLNGEHKTMAKYPCRNCVYFKACGDNMRLQPCQGRKTKSEKKREDC